MYGREAPTKNIQGQPPHRYSEQMGMVEKFTAVCYNKTII